jgi:ABC-2 type transport system ATP-binding protein
MSILTQNITKVYGTQKALDKVSFEVPSGQIVGFLGPNGAGKSTMMKILTCFIPQSEGQANVCGFDVVNNPIDVKRQVGYLPEHNPLYLEMYVKEYLSFCASIHGLGKQADKLVKEMIEKTGLGPEQHKIIGTLSKGYRQRVGLAQAMIHNPKVLILDEPTSGLDPNQLVGIRELIRNLGKEKTVMLSTHIMQEVEAVCDRVIIINKGRIVADNSIGAMQHQGNKSVVSVEFDKSVSEKLLKTIPGVERVKITGQNTWLLEGKLDFDLRPAIFKFAVESGLAVLTLQKEEQSLEETFQKLTKEA